MNYNFEEHSQDIHDFAQGLLREARRFIAYNVNGYNFGTLQLE